MKLAKHSNSFQSNVKAQTEDFGIGDASVVIEILRNRLYEHKIRTCVQEYLCNARDAHREVGNTKPIQATLPTQFSPTFKVRDFGPGISPDRMQNVFVKYGASTKRKDNLQTGGFGIGAKSAWSYTDSFTIVTYIDGTKRTYVAHTGVSNNGRLDLISTDTTKEENGTEIQIAVKPEDVQEFQYAAFRATYFWDVKPQFKGTTQVPERVRGTMVTPELEVFKYSPFDGNLELGAGNDALLVLDGVPYELSDRMFARIPELQKLRTVVPGKLVIYLQNGAVSVSASREKIDDSQQTIDSLKVLAKGWYASVTKLVNDKFAKAKTMPQFLAVYRELKDGFNITEFATFGTYKIDYSDRLVNDTFKKVSITEVEARNGRYRRRSTPSAQNPSVVTTVRYREVTSLGIADLDNLFYVDVTESKVALNRRLKEHLATHRTAHLIAERPNEAAAFKAVLSDLSVRGVSSIQYTPPPKAARVKVLRDNKQFCMHVFNGGRHEYTTLASNKQQWLYFEVTDAGFKYDANKARELEYWLKDAGIDYRVCGLATKAIGMVKNNANFSPLADWIADFKPNQDHVASHKRMQSKHSDLINSLTEIAKADSLEDWFLTEMIGEYKAIAKAKPLTLPDLIIATVKTLTEVKDFETKDVQLAKHMGASYPLFESLSYHGKRQTADVALYLNAKFKQLKKEGKVK